MLFSESYKIINENHFHVCTTKFYNRLLMSVLSLFLVSIEILHKNEDMFLICPMSESDVRVYRQIGWSVRS